MDINNIISDSLEIILKNYAEFDIYILNKLLTITNSISGSIIKNKEIKTKIGEIPDNIIYHEIDNESKINETNDLIPFYLMLKINNGFIILSGRETQYPEDIIKLCLNIISIYEKLSTIIECCQKERKKITDLFIANISHELKTLLNGIIGMAQLLADTNLSAVQKEYSNSINECSIQLLAIINDILDFSKIENSKIKLVMQPLNIRNCLESAYDIVMLKASEKNIDLNIYIEPIVPNTIIGDLTRLKQILINLLSNAIKYTNDGEVKTIVNRLDENKIIFEIHDTGLGINPNEINELFKPFVRMNDIITKTESGTGLGLPIAKHLVELMGGEIWIESEVDKGTIVYFTIEVEDAIIDETPNYEQLIGKNVLIVDDNITNRKILTTTFIKWEAKPLAVSSAEEALIYINSNHYEFDLILIDICMPKISGIQLSKEIHKIRPDIPLIAISSIATLSEKDTIYFKSIITKPIKNTKLLDICINYETKKEKDKKMKETKILIVDDTNINRIVSTNMLKRLKYKNIKSVNNGEEAIDEVKRNKYDIIFMDLIMNRIDGFQCRNKIIEEIDYLPIFVATSANSTEEMRDKCSRNEFNAFLEKPLIMKDLEILLDIIEKKIYL